MIDMIVSSCPLRISLVGGSTDNPKFIEKYGKGAVISFPSTLRTYVTIHQDIFGTNSIENNYNIKLNKPFFSNNLLKTYHLKSIANINDLYYIWEIPYQKMNIQINVLVIVY